MVLIVHSLGAFPEGDADDSRDAEHSDMPAEVPLITHAILIVHTFGAFPEGDADDSRDAEHSDMPAEVPLITHATDCSCFWCFPEGRCGQFQGCGAFRYACRGASHNTWY